MNTPSFSARRSAEALLGRLGPGLLLSAAVAAAAIEVGGLPWFARHGLSALSAAIVLGILLGNTIYRRIAPAAGDGVNFSRSTLLRAGVVLYGLRLTGRDIGQVGWSGVIIDAVVLASTFALAWLAGTRLLRLDRVTAILIGAGSAICGAAAVLATEPVVRGKAEQVSIAVATVVAFGTLAVFAYPALYQLNLHWAALPSGPRAFGIYAGSTIHEVAQVFAAGRSISTETANTAVITKMVRVMMLAPFLLGLSVWLGRMAPRQVTPGHSAPAGGANRELVIPWFAFGFIGVVLVNSFATPGPGATRIAIGLDNFLLAMAMASLGLTTHWSSVRAAGARPLVLAALLFAWLVAGGALINRFVMGFVH
jgi:uncharacterized integral membrane protein (TIGR00698 family)